MTQEMIAVPANILKAFVEAFKSTELHEVAEALTCVEVEALADMVSAGMLATGANVGKALEVYEMWICSHAVQDTEDDAHGGYAG